MAARWLAEKDEGAYHIAVKAADFKGIVAERAEQGNELALTSLV